jgi:hypothetical protein
MDTRSEEWSTITVALLPVALLIGLLLIVSLVGVAMQMAAMRRVYIVALGILCAGVLANYAVGWMAVIQSIESGNNSRGSGGSRLHYIMWDLRWVVWVVGDYWFLFVSKASTLFDERASHL